MKIRGTIIRGHGVASGMAGDPRYPNGTLYLQLPYFKEQGLDLSPYFLGTLNLDIAPYQFRVRKPKYFLQNIAWSGHIPPENFYFFDLDFFWKEHQYRGLIYMPDPETKVDHRQKGSVLELILPKIPDISYGNDAIIQVQEDQLMIYENLI